MLRARYPLAAALLAAPFILFGSTAAVAGGTGSANPVDQAVTQATGSGGDTSGTADGTDTTGTGTTGSDGTTTGGSTATGGDGSGDGSGTSSGTGGSTDPTGGVTDPTGGLPSGGSGSTPTNPLAGTPLSGLGDTLTDPSSIPTSLQTLGTCLQNAGTDTTAGQVCFENFLGALGLPNTNCFSQNGFTLAQAQAKLEQALTGGQSQLTPEQFNNNFQQLGTQLQDLVTCLTNTAPTGGGGAATTPSESPTPEATSDVAPAATPVSGTPNFTG